jgi:cytochrome c-type biogenesis protein CcmF
VSRNTRNMDLRFLNEAFNNNADILLYKGDTVLMGDHYVHYRQKRQDGPNLVYDMDYFAVAPRDYRTGDTVRVGDMLFRARNDHRATEFFLQDQPAHWDALEGYSLRALWHAREWSPSLPGERSFALAPFVQINPRFGNVAEPSTRHWLQRDLYTHVRYADLAMASDTADDAWMADRLYEKQEGDTIITPTAIVIIDSVYMVRDSVTLKMLGDKFQVYAAKLRVRDLYQRDRWFDARPMVIYGNGEVVAGKAAEIAPLRIKYGLASVDLNNAPAIEGGRPAGPVKVGMNVAEAEFVVMQAIMFPGINILWIGCVLLALGTGMAVWQRIRKKPAQNA